LVTEKLDRIFSLVIKLTIKKIKQQWNLSCKWVCHLHIVIVGFRY
jgi:hypothetical protein